MPALFLVGACALLYWFFLHRTDETLKNIFYRCGVFVTEIQLLWFAVKVLYPLKRHRHTISDSSPLREEEIKQDTRREVYEPLAQTYSPTLNPFVFNKITVIKEIRNFKRCGIGSIRTVNCIAFNIGSEITTNGPFLSFFWICSSHDSSPCGNRFLTFENKSDRRTRRHIRG